MKKLFTLLTIAVLFSCSSEDNKQVKEDPYTNMAMIKANMFLRKEK